MQTATYNAISENDVKNAKICQNVRKNNNTNAQFVFRTGNTGCVCAVRRGSENKEDSNTIRMNFNVDDSTTTTTPTTNDAIRIANNSNERTLTP